MLEGGRTRTPLVALPTRRTSVQNLPTAFSPVRPLLVEGVEEEEEGLEEMSIGGLGDEEEDEAYERWKKHMAAGASQPGSQATSAVPRHRSKPALQRY